MCYRREKYLDGRAYCKKPLGLQLEESGTRLMDCAKGREIFAHCVRTIPIGTFPATVIAIVLQKRAVNGRGQDAAYDRTICGTVASLHHT